MLDYKYITAIFFIRDEAEEHLNKNKSLKEDGFEIKEITIEGINFYAITSQEYSEKKDLLNKLK